LIVSVAAQTGTEHRSRDLDWASVRECHPTALEDMVGECDPAKTPPVARDVKVALPM
jgi:hypothetical protein